MAIEEQQDVASSDQDVAVEQIAVEYPATGEVIAHVPVMSPEDVADCRVERLDVLLPVEPVDLVVPELVGGGPLRAGRLH